MRSPTPRRCSSPRRWARCPGGRARRSRRRPRTASSPTSARPSARSSRRIDDPRFVGGHPLAGAETAGVEHARADLFDGATWYLTPTPTHVGRALRAPAPAAARPRRPAGGDRPRDPRHDPRDGLAPAARARQRARRPGRASACGGRRAAAGDRPELPRRDPRGGRAERDLDRHLPLQPRRARARDRRRRSRAWRASATLLARRRRATRITAWNDAAAADRRRLLEAPARRRPAVASCARRCPTGRA